MRECPKNYPNGVHMKNNHFEMIVCTIVYGYLDPFAPEVEVCPMQASEAHVQTKVS